MELNMIRHLSVCGSLLALASLAGGGAAWGQDLNVPTTAAIAVPGGTTATLHWNGRGQSRDGVPVCVSSPTGRYEISIRTASGRGLVGDQTVPYVVAFESGGTSHSAVLSQATSVARFEGVVDPARSCASGPNARIILSLDATAATAATSGNYSDQVTISVEPR
jgi:hypothetical protein